MTFPILCLQSCLLRDIDACWTSSTNSITSGVLRRLRDTVNWEMVSRACWMSSRDRIKNNIYTLGKRKTSSARVWMISSSHAHTLSSSPNSPTPTSTPPTTEILINNVPLNRYFTVPTDRERILRPFTLAGLLGAYNVFALTRGGGISGQSGAVAHGIAKGLAAHVPDVELILRRAKLLRRDPRMVERKKTGLAKARKAYAWVKR